MSVSSLFNRLAKWASRFTGRPLCFALALLVVLAWVVTGPIFQFSNTWQLVINTGTTIVTFLIQNTQNRDTAALQLKLEDLTEDEMAHIKRTFMELARSSPHLDEEARAPEGRS